MKWQIKKVEIIHKKKLFTIIYNNFSPNYNNFILADEILIFKIIFCPSTGLHGLNNYIV